MTKIIKLTEEDFELPNKIYYTKDEDVILGIRLFNLTLAKKVMKRILDDQEKAEKWDILENAKTHEALVKYAELEKDNKQLKEENKYERAQKIVLRDTVHNDTTTIINLKQKLEKIKEHCKDNGRRSETFFAVWMRELKEILEEKN